MKRTGHPYGWTGHVVVLKVPECKGGSVDEKNMEWMTAEEAADKAKTECQ